MRYGRPFTIVLSLYLITGVLYVWYNYFKNYTLLHLFNALFPALIFVFVSFFFFYVGVSNLSSKCNNKRQMLLRIALLVQVVQFSFFGYVFANYIGPYVSIGFYFEPSVKFDVDVSIYSWLFSNGYAENAQSKLFLNLFPLLLLVLLKALHQNSESRNE